MIGIYIVCQMIMVLNVTLRLVEKRYSGWILTVLIECIMLTS